MSVDTKYTYNSLPYNLINRNDTNDNRGGLKPSFQYKKSRTIWLDTYYATSSISSGTTYYEFSFDITPFQLYNQTKLSVISFTVNENTSKPMIIKIKNLQYDGTSYYSSDKEGFPILFISHTGANGMLANDKISLTLVPQTISNITIKTCSDFINKDSGITISAQNVGTVVIGLLFEDADLIPDNTISQYK